MADGVPLWLLAALIVAAAAIPAAIMLVLDPLRPRMTLFRPQPGQTWATQFYHQQAEDEHDLACRTEDAILDAIPEGPATGEPPWRAGR